MRFVPFLAGAFCSLAAAGAAALEAPRETLAIAQFRSPPEYPASCMPEQGESKPPQRVTVAYDVSRKGLPEMVRVTESTDPCFNETAVAAVRSWTFEPRRVDGKPVDQSDLETTFTFVFAGPTVFEDFDARPVFRQPPEYPENCLRTAGPRETVVVVFDVTTKGTTENIRTVSATNACLKKPAEKSVAKWRYRPKTVGGQPVRREGVQMTIVFELTSATPPSARVRDSFFNALMRAQRKAREEGGAAEALDLLAEIEAKYGPEFSKAELSAFHQVRAGARLAAKDYRGALDDLRIVRRVGSLDPEQAEQIDKLIVQLEAVVAAEDKAPAQTQPQSQ